MTPLDPLLATNGGATGISPPTVTVVIPTRDRWDLLPVALRAALAQEGVQVDVVVADDGSATQAPAECAELRDERVELVRSEQSLGLAGARNLAIARATGDWIAFLDDDDVWAPEKLARQIAAATASRTSWAYCGVVIVDPDGMPIYQFPVADPADVLQQLLRMNVVAAGASNVLVEASRLRALGGFDADFSRLADWDLWLRLAAAGPAAAVDEVLVGYRYHAANMSAAGSRAALAELDRLVEKHGALSAEHGIAFDRAGIERWLEAERRRGRRARARADTRSGRRLRAARTYLGAAVADRNLEDARAAIAVLGGERTGRLAARVRRAAPAAAPKRVTEPDWLTLYR